MGYETSLTELVDASGNRVGYLKATWADERLVEDGLAGDPLWFRTESGGWCLPEPDDLQKRWEKVKLYMNDRSPEPTDEAGMRAYLAEIEKAAMADLDVWLSHSTTPFVAYIRLSEQWQRKGLARELYVASAVELGKVGRVLRASTLQQPEAAAAWERLAADSSLPISKQTFEYANKVGQEIKVFESYVLDFRTPKRSMDKRESSSRAVQPSRRAAFS